MPVRIPTFSPEGGLPKSYEDLFDQLRKAPRFVTLGAHQSPALRQYEGLRPAHPDIAITLPTGTGKTLVALLLARMHQLRTDKRVLYICPNKQLVRQVVDEAADLGIVAKNITGSWRERVDAKERVNPEAQDLYTRNKAIGVATYSSVFNSNPRLPEADLIIFDDAHAAGEAVASPWCLDLDRDVLPESFEHVENLLRKHVDKAQLLALGPKPAPGTKQAQLVPHRAWLRIIPGVEAALGDASERKKLGEAEFPWRLLNGRLARSFCFLSPNRITIRAWGPAPFENSLFTQSRQRVYLSATLEEWGHLEHIFGISTVKTVPGVAVKEPGRRLIITAQHTYPKLTDKQRMLRLVSLSPKTLILVSSRLARKRVVEDLQEQGFKGILASDKVEDDVEAFKKANAAILVLANRYDGLNLGNGVCKQIVIVGKPTAVNVHEEFTTKEWGLVQAANARARERILQGVGRCTRNNQDHCLVSLIGQELASFVNDKDLRESLPPRIRAEFRLGEATIEGLSGDDPDETLRSWLQSNADWVSTHAKFDNEQGTKPLPEQLQKALQEINRAESRFNEYHWTRKHELAEDLAAKTAHRMEEAHFREEAAAWDYLAAVAADTQEHSKTGSVASQAGTALLRSARGKGQDREWFGYLERHLHDKTAGTANPRQVDGIIRFLSENAHDSKKFADRNIEALDGLEKSKPGPFHAGLSRLGRSLGYETALPKAPGVSDGIWHLESTVCFNFEVKTDKKNDCLSIKEVRQIKEQLDEIAANDGLIVPHGARTTCVTQCDAIASRKGHDLERFDVARPNTIHSFAKQWFSALEEVARKEVQDTADQRAHITTALVNHGATGQSLAGSLGIRPAAQLIAVTKAIAP